MVTGRLPWTQHNQTALMQQIQNADFEIPEDISPLCQEVIRGLMEPDPVKRWPIPKILEHPWVSSAPPFRNLQMPGAKKPDDPISLRQLDRFFGRDISDASIGNENIIRSGSIININYEDTLKNIAQEAKKPTNQTARIEVPQRMVFHKTGKTNAIFTQIKKKQRPPSSSLSRVNHNK